MQRDPRTYAIIGAAMEVHRELGPGFLESVYQEAIAVEMAVRSIPFVREKHLSVNYKNQPLTTSFRADFVCYDSVLVEIKALRTCSGTEESQILNYLKATGHTVGLMLNFGRPSLGHKRFIFSS